jgi:glyoxylase-like metal-dependent hydrolase (beta-lactamase superfamily II)
MKIAVGIEMLEIPATIQGAQTFIYPTLIWDSKTTILVDAGFPGQLSEFRQTIMEGGASFERIDKIIVTHHDRDHIGSLRTILNELPQKASVFSHQEERPYIEGRIPPFKATLFQQQKLDYLNFTVGVDRIVEDGEVLPFCGGITIIHTPGHTPGHICLYIGQSKTLIAGDALFVVEGDKLGPPPKLVSLDWPSAVRSLGKLVPYDVETVICYHGGAWRGNFSRSITELAGLQ